MSAPRLVASDLDGTLVRSDLSVSDRTREVLARVEQAGSLFVMVTGRPPRWMAQVAQDTGHRGLAVCANGALVYDLHTERVVQDFRIDGATTLRLVASLKAQVPGIAFAVEKGLDGFGREPAYIPRWDNGELVVAPIEELVEPGVAKLLARVEGAGSDDLLARTRAVVGELAVLTTATFSETDGLLELSAAGVTKAFGLERLAAQHGIGPEDVVAFGDMPNDLPMLVWAGHAVAVANAHPDVIAVADEVTATNDEDGVAQVVERLIRSR